MIYLTSNPIVLVRFVLVSLLAVASSIYYPLYILGSAESEELFYGLLVCNILINGWDLLANYKIYNQNKDNFSSLSRELGEDKKYKWLTLDLVSLFPYEIFGLPILLLLRSLKLFRLSQHQRLWRRRDLKRNDVLYIIFFLFWATLAAHLLACGWIALEPLKAGMDNSTIYVEALYWTVQTLTTVGYGDHVAETQGQMIYSMVVMMFGVGIYGWLIGNVAGILSKRDAVEQYYYDNMERLKAIVGNRGLPANLQHKIREYYDYIYLRNYSGSDEKIFINSLPESLRQEVSVSLKQKIIRRISAFSDVPESFIKEVASELKTEIFIPGDVIFEEGAEGDKMYFLLSGELEVVVGENKKVVAVLYPGDLFGEIALFENTTRNASILSKSYSELYSLDKSTFHYVLLRFPEIAQRILAKAKERKAERNEGNYASSQ